jgi:hypothetical protein
MELLNLSDAEPRAELAVNDFIMQRQLERELQELDDNERDACHKAMPPRKNDFDMNGEQRGERRLEKKSRCRQSLWTNRIEW